MSFGRAIGDAVDDLLITAIALAFAAGVLGTVFVWALWTQVLSHITIGWV